jgi:hypothetical protein
MKENSRVKNQYVVEKMLVFNARPNDIFKVLMDVEQWNRWTPSITQILILNCDRPEIGAKIKVLQPKLPPAIWIVTEMLPDESLTWEKKSFGLLMRLEHVITTCNKMTNVTIRTIYKGPLAGLFFMITHSLTDRYMTMEIEGLKLKCEKG